MPNYNLNEAKRAKYDEFYTQLPDIERELAHYPDAFRGKTVYCNCDDPTVSNFFVYFAHRFRDLGLKKLVTTCYQSDDGDMFSNNESKRGLKLEYNGQLPRGKTVPTVEDIGRTRLKGNGSFRSAECVKLLERADVVVTNPPFSLFREYVAQLVEHDKEFLVIGPLNAITYKDIFPLIRDDKMWLGHGFRSGNAYFRVAHTDDYAHQSYFDLETGLVKLRNVGWLTNLDLARRHEPLPLWKRYTPEEYPTYDNYDAVEVAKLSHIPCDYDGLMGVPRTFLEKHNPEQFEIVGMDRPLITEMTGKQSRFKLGGKELYARIVIKRR